MSKNRAFGMCGRKRFLYPVDAWRDRHMYYVLQVAPGEEDKAEALMMVILPEEIYGECFHLTRKMKKKFHGRWVDMREKLLPGYVFITTENAEELFLELKKVPMVTNILGRDGWSFAQMDACDVEWLEKIRECSVQFAVNNKKMDSRGMPWYEVGLSQVSVEEEQIRIVSGPLKGIQGMIRKIHLHKRIAEVEISFMRRKTVIYLGVELLEKQMIQQ